MKTKYRLSIVLVLFLLGSSMRVSAEGATPRWWLLGAQLTSINQVNTHVPGPYYNPAISIGPGSRFGWSDTISIYGAVSPWKGAIVMLEPEYALGRGMPNASGTAGYPNGEMVRTGSLGKYPPPYIARAFYHQEFALGSKPNPDGLPAEGGSFEDKFMPSGDYHLGKVVTFPRLMVTIGKFSPTDFFDVSNVATDPRHHFMNWALMQNGAWDAAADVKGYTYGTVLEFEDTHFAIRGGILLMPTMAQGKDLDWHLRHNRSEVAEGEYRYAVGGQKGRIKVMGYINQGHMGNYNEAIAAAPTGTAPDITAVAKRGAIKYGGGVLIDQNITDWLQAFLRASVNNGQTETFNFTEIDQAVSFGVDMTGKYWHRDQDHLAFGTALSGLSGSHRRYLAAGGSRFQLGDGALTYGWETIMEMYYLVPIKKHLELTVDAQGIFNPGMNEARGPLGVFGARVHIHI